MPPTQPLLTLSPMGQLPSVSKYIILTLCFSLPDAHADHPALETLVSAAAKLTEAFPFLAGQVVITPPPESVFPAIGVHSVVEYPPHQGERGFVSVKDCRGLMGGFGELVGEGAPAEGLDGEVCGDFFLLLNSCYY